MAEAVSTELVELVTNAILHAGPAIEVRISRTDRSVHVAVRDGGADPPRRRDDRYGLRIVDAFAAQWSMMPTSAGKVVWAVIHRPPEPGGRIPPSPRTGGRRG